MTYDARCGILQKHLLHKIPLLTVQNKLVYCNVGLFHAQQALLKASVRQSLLTLTVSGMISSIDKSATAAAIHEPVHSQTVFPTSLVELIVHYLFFL